MNILDIQEALKDFSEQQLIKEMQSPSGNAPQFLVLSELNRRKRMKADFQARQAQQAPTVAEALVASAGVPTQEMTQMSAQMAPSTDMAQNSGVMAMKKGGLASNHLVDSDGVQHAAIFLPFLAGLGKAGLYGGAGMAGAIGLGKAYDYFYGDDEEEEQGVKLNREEDDDDAMPDGQGSSQEFTLIDPNSGKETKSEKILAEIMEEYQSLSDKAVRDADMNKYLALAAAGFQLMQPDEGGFAGAASKAGLAGLKTLQDSDAAYNKAVTDRLGTKIKLYDATKPKDPISQLGDIAKAISVLQVEKQNAFGDKIREEQIQQQIDYLLMQQRSLAGITQGSNAVKVN